MKTGRGKGNMILQLIGMYQQKTLILCHNIKTVLDMIDKFKKFTNYEP
jgi:superfamily II DNA or RNA helicase